MEIKEETHLNSSSDQTHYPNNTASKFKVKLPHTIRLASVVDWYVSCDNVIIPREVNYQALVPMIKVNVDNFLDSDNAHLDKEHAKRVRCNRKTFHEFTFTLLDDNDKLIEFGKGKTQINMTLRPMPVSRFLLSSP